MKQTDVCKFPPDYSGSSSNSKQTRKISHEYRLVVWAESANTNDRANHILKLFAQQMSHGFNNILQPVMTFYDVISADDAVQPEHTPYFRRAEEAIDIGVALTQRLAILASDVEAPANVIDVADILTPEADRSGITLTMPHNVEDRLIAIAEPDLRTLVSEIIANATDASNGLLAMAAAVRKTHHFDDLMLQKPMIVLSFSDTGRGMDSRTLSHCLTPLFSTKRGGAVRGLGFSMVDRVIAGLHGGMVISTTPGVGTEVEIYLPQYERTQTGMTQSP